MLRIRDALREGMKKLKIQALGGWLDRIDPADPKCERHTPAACVMQTIAFGVAEARGNRRFRFGGDYAHNYLLRVFPFLKERPKYRPPWITSDERWNMMKFAGNVIGVAINANDEHHLSRDEITAWLELHEVDWIKRNPQRATLDELRGAAKYLEKLEGSSEDREKVGESIKDIRKEMNLRETRAQRCV